MHNNCCKMFYVMSLNFVVLSSSVFAMYDTHTGRFLNQDPLGITPNPQQPNRFDIKRQYSDGMNLYEYVLNNPMKNIDGYGLSGLQYTWEDCQKLRNNRIIKYNAAVASCFAESGVGIGEDVVKCIAGCAIIGTGTGIACPAVGAKKAFGICMAACEGLSGLTNSWVWGHCIDAAEQIRQSINKSYAYCMCRADGCSTRECLHHYD